MTLPLGYGLDPYGLGFYGGIGLPVSSARVQFYASKNDGTINEDYELVSIDGVFLGDVSVAIYVTRRDYRKFFLKNTGVIGLQNVRLWIDDVTDPNDWIEYAEAIPGAVLPRDGNANVSAGDGPGVFVSTGYVLLGELGVGDVIGVWIKREIINTTGINSDNVEAPKFKIDAEIAI
jgi:hypothetical protein